MRIHDLLELDAQRLLAAHSPVPEWVGESLRRAPFGVVRRGLITEHEIPIGVRGTRRNERWGASYPPSLVGGVLTPSDLLQRAVPVSEAAALPPALRALSVLAERWQGFKRTWGPAGSVGFELATGSRVVRPESDLDVVIYAETHLSIEEAQDLRDTAKNLPAAVDIRVETPLCGFSLLEYASRGPRPILLRVPSGVVLGSDPWDQPDRADARRA